jgi:hypothetical protein
MIKAPSTNIQAPEKLQTSSINGTVDLELGSRNFSGALSLGFGGFTR